MISGDDRLNKVLYIYIGGENRSIMHAACRQVTFSRRNLPLCPQQSLPNFLFYVGIVHFKHRDSVDVTKPWTSRNIFAGLYNAREKQDCQSVAKLYPSNVSLFMRSAFASMRSVL